MVGDEERQRGAEQAEQEDLSPQPGLEVVCSVLSADHSPPISVETLMAERILLVDDHPLTRSALAGLLTQHGFEVVGEASDGEEAVEAAGRLEPDLILLDLSMPGVDGLS